MGFQILNKNGEAIQINSLDEEVAFFWGVELDDKRYAVEYPRNYFEKGSKGDMKYHSQISWFDSVGWVIHAYQCNDWKEVIQKMDEQLVGEHTLEEVFPKRFQLIKYWEGKGYTPKYVNG